MERASRELKKAEALYKRHYYATLLPIIPDLYVGLLFSCGKTECFANDANWLDIPQWSVEKFCTDPGRKMGSMIQRSKSGDAVRRLRIRTANYIRRGEGTHVECWWSSTAVELPCGLVEQACGQFVSLTRTIY